MRREKVRKRMVYTRKSRRWFRRTKADESERCYDFDDDDKNAD